MSRSMVEQKIRPAGYLSSGDIAQLGAIRGLQVAYFLEDYGKEISGRLYISKEMYDELEKRGTVYRYKTFPTYKEFIRPQKRRRDYRRRFLDELIR